MAEDDDSVGEFITELAAEYVPPFPLVRLRLNLRDLPLNSLPADSKVRSTLVPHSPMIKPAISSTDIPCTCKIVAYCHNIAADT